MTTEAGDGAELMKYLKGLRDPAAREALQHRDHVIAATEGMAGPSGAGITEEGVLGLMGSVSNHISPPTLPLRVLFSHQLSHSTFSIVLRAFRS